MHNILTIDVEEYYHAENILRSLPEAELRKLPDRVEIGVNKILDILAKSGSKATFFVLGCVAEKNRDLIKKIAAGGHEIASHGYFHTPLTMHTPESFDEDLGRSVKLLADITGQKILGYRATSFSLREDMTWFFDVLRKYGIIYDSSIAKSFFRKACPTCHPERSDEVPPVFRREGSIIFQISHGITEFPVSHIKLGPLTLPMGGGYFRLYPYWLTKWGIDHSGSSDKSPFVFYLHPWELDPEQPRVKLSPLKQFRHYADLAGTEKKLAKMVDQIKFTSIAEYQHLSLREG